MFHFHGFQHHQLRPGLNRLTCFNQNPHDAAVHWRSQPALMTVAGFDSADRVVRLDTPQLAFPLQIQRIALTDSAQVTTHSVVLDNQCFTQQSGVATCTQRQRAILALATQVQGDFRRQTRAQTAIASPWRTRVISPRNARQALRKRLRRHIPERITQLARSRQQLLLITRNKTGIQFCRRERGVSDDPPEKIDIGFQPANRKLIEHAQQSQTRLLTIFTPGNQLAEHRVVERRNLVTFCDAAIYPPSRAIG